MFKVGYYSEKFVGFDAWNMQMLWDEIKLYPSSPCFKSMKHWQSKCLRFFFEWSCCKVNLNSYVSNMSRLLPRNKAPNLTNISVNNNIFMFRRAAIFCVLVASVYLFRFFGHFSFTTLPTQILHPIAIRIFWVFSFIPFLLPNYSSFISWHLNRKHYYYYSWTMADECHRQLRKWKLKKVRLYSSTKHR